MSIRLVFLFLIFSSEIYALSTSQLSKELQGMLDNSHRLKSSYYSYLESVANQELTHALGYPSFYTTFSPYNYNWTRVSPEEIGGGLIGDLANTSDVDLRILRNLGHQLRANQDGTPLIYEDVTKDDNVYSIYSAGMAHTFIDFGSQKAMDHMAKIGTQNNLNSYMSEKQEYIISGLNIYIQIVTSKNIISYANFLKKEISEDFINQNSTDSINTTNQDKVKSVIGDIDVLIVNEEEKLSAAINQYKYLFGHAPENISDYKLLSIPKNKLPKSKEIFIQSVKENNLKLQSAKNNIIYSKEKYKNTIANQYPTITANIDSSIAYNENGYNMQTENYSVSVSANYRTTFFTNRHKNKIAKLEIMRNQENFKDLELSVIQHADRMWNELSFNKQKMDYQIKAMYKARDFVKNASKEYENGERSLLDILDTKVSILKQGIKVLESYNAYTLQSFKILQINNELNYKDITTQNIQVKKILDEILLDKIKIIQRQESTHMEAIKAIDEWLVETENS